MCPINEIHLDPCWGTVMVWRVMSCKTQLHWGKRRVLFTTEVHVATKKIATLLNMPVSHLSRKARNEPVIAIYGLSFAGQTPSMGLVGPWPALRESWATAPFNFGRRRIAFLEMKLAFVYSNVIYYRMRQLNNILLHRDWEEKLKTQIFCDGPPMSKSACVFFFLSQSLSRKISSSWLCGQGVALLRG